MQTFFSYAKKGKDFTTQSLPFFNGIASPDVLIAGASRNEARKTEKTVLKSTVNHKENNSRKEAMLTLRVFLTNHPPYSKCYGTGIRTYSNRAYPHDNSGSAAA